uniref:Uncharacterized protein n=1 Tax=Rhizophora mucronata TaxID=61149 RepID=A0A2P2Q221_RHIMU
MLTKCNLSKTKKKKELKKHLSWDSFDTKDEEIAIIIKR